ncbi:MAG: protein kinase [Bacteroidia bacterium]|nr:protein kinase [Bacteroidia bacterium]
MAAEISISGYRTTRLLARKGFYEWWEALSETGEKAAIKWIRPEFVGSSRVQKEYQRELDLALLGPQKGLSRYLGHIQSPELMGIVYEMPGGRSVKDELRQKGGMDESTAISAVVTLLHTLEYLHSREKVAGNINYENTWLQPDGSLLIQDYARDAAEVLGFATSLSSYGVENISFRSPQLLSDDSAPDIHSDLYAAGMLLFTMISGKAPFNPAEQPLSEIFSQMMAMKLPTIKISSYLAPRLQKLLSQKEEIRYSNTTEALKGFLGPEYNSPFENRTENPLIMSMAEEVENDTVEAEDSSAIESLREPEMNEIEPNAIEPEAIESEDKICANPGCGAIMPYSAQFCGKCGQPIVESPGYVCRHCRHRYPQSLQACPYCKTPKV